MLFGNPGGDGGGTDAGNTHLQGALAITPLTPSVAVTTGQAPQPVQFMATVGGTPTGVAWGIDRGELGTINSTGLFTPTGTLGGTATVTAVYGSQTVTTTITINVLTTQQGDPAWMAGPLDAGTGGYMGVGGDGPGAAPSMAQVTTLASDAGTRRRRSGREVHLSVRRHRLAAGTARAAAPVEPGHALVRLRLRAHQGEELRVPGLLRGEQDAAS